MKKPIDTLMDEVEWKPLPTIMPQNSILPFATHQGVLKIGELEMQVFRLSNGQAVISEQGMLDFMKWMGFGDRP